jgi:hypothetical protein
MMGEILEQIERMVLIGLFACLALCLACVGISVCCIKVRSRWQRQRAEHSFRADVARGLAETEQFLQTWDTWTLREEPRDSGNDDVG